MHLNDSFTIKTIEMPGGALALPFSTMSDQIHSNGTTPINIGASPVLPDPDGSVEVLASKFIEDAERLNALKDSLERQRAKLIGLARPFHLNYNAQAVNTASSITARAAANQTLRITFPNRYQKIQNQKRLLELVGSSGAYLFTDHLTITIKVGDMDQALLLPMLDDLREVMGRYGLEFELDQRTEFRPIGAFHAERHRIFTPEQNAQIDELAPSAVMIRRPGKPKTSTTPASNTTTTN